MKPVLCPVCNGRGKVEEKTCHGCGGKGWVEVAEDYYCYSPYCNPPYYYPPYCPSLPSTGAPSWGDRRYTCKEGY